MEKLCVKGCMPYHCSNELAAHCDLSAYNFSGMCGAKCTECDGTINAVDDQYICDTCGKTTNEEGIIELKAIIGKRSWYGGKNKLKALVFKNNNTDGSKHSITKFVNAVKEMSLSEIYAITEENKANICPLCKAGLTKFADTGSDALYQCNNSKCNTRYARNIYDPNDRVVKIVLNGCRKYTKV